MTLFDFICGSRLHLCVFFLLGLFDDLVCFFEDFFFCLIFSLFFCLDLFDYFVFNNRVFYTRLRGLGVIDIFDINFLVVSGVLARSGGII